jgi:cytochrome c-type biogenesis protein CcmF
MYDLYLAPQQVREGRQADHLFLEKGQVESVDDVYFSFLGFDMTSHDGAEGGVRVGASLKVWYLSDTVLVSPAVIHTENAAGQPMLEHEDATVEFPDRSFQVSIEQINADQGAVVLSVPGLMREVEPERLILEVSKKPLIMLVWIGTTIILLGTLVSTLRRFGEFPKKVVRQANDGE